MRHQERPDDVAEVVWCRHRPHRILALGASRPFPMREGNRRRNVLAPLLWNRVALPSASTGCLGSSSVGPWRLALVALRPAAAFAPSIRPVWGTSFSPVQIERVMSFCIRQVRTAGKFYV